MGIEKPGLRRVIGTPLLALYGIGNIVGAGVYVLIGKVAEPAGYLSILAFLIAALVAFGAALSYAELATRFPVSAGVAVYLHEAFRTKYLSMIVGLFLVTAGVVSSAVLIKGFAGYFYTLVPISPSLVMIGIVCILIGIALKGIRESVGFAGLLTIIEVGGLIFLVASILIAQPAALSSFSSDFGTALGDIDLAVFGGLISAAFIAFYAFIGFEDMVNVAEEVRKPKKAFPRAIIASMIVVTILYVAVAVATLAVVTPEALGKSDAPLADAYSAATNNEVGVIVVISLMATLNGVMVNLIMGSRFLYGMATRAWISPWFAQLSKTHVPSRGLVSVGTVALLCALWVPLERLAQLTSFLLLCVFIAVNISLIVVRRRGGETAKELQLSPTFMPWFAAIASFCLLAGQGIVTLMSLF
jgi:APA family basic amino acid/polyamine antiporter